MARGDVTLFDEFLAALGAGVHDLASDTLKMGLVTNGVTPTAGDSSPAWGDYSASEVATTGGYVAGGVTLTTVTYTEAAGVASLDSDPVSLVLDGSGFTNAYWGILYNDTAAGDEAIGFVDLGGPVSEQAGDVVITPHANGWFRNIKT